MTTIRQITTILLRPLVERHDDLAIVGGRFLAIKPVHHILRGVFVDRTSSKASFQPHWGMATLFWPRKQPPMSNQIQSLGSMGIDAEGTQDAFCAMVETEVLPWMRTVTTLSAYVEEGLARDRRRALIRPEDRFLIHLALGEFEAALARWLEIRAGWDRMREDPALEAPLRINRLRALGHLLLADDRTAIAALFHAWEAQSVATLKIGHLWERTPFPLEEATSGAGAPASAAPR